VERDSGFLSWDMGSGHAIHQSCGVQKVWCEAFRGSCLLSFDQALARAESTVNQSSVMMRCFHVRTIHGNVIRLVCGSPASMVSFSKICDTCGCVGGGGGGGDNVLRSAASMTKGISRRLMFRRVFTLDSNVALGKLSGISIRGSAPCIHET